MKFEVTVLTGLVPNLPWWKCLAMTDTEIKEFNRSHLKETKMKFDAELMTKSNAKDYRLKIKNKYRKKSGEIRYNHITCYMVDDALQMHIHNGHNKEGIDIKGSIRLSQSEMKELMEFVQRNIK